MASYYQSQSWKVKKESKRNKRRATLLFITTFILIVFIVAFGLPLIVKFSGLISDLKSSNVAFDKSDTTPPPPPVLNTMPKYTNEETLEIAGSAEPGSTVYVFSPTEETETLVGGDGRFSVKIELAESLNTIYAISKDLSGNESRKTPDFTVIYDKTAPDINIEKPENEQKFFGEAQRQITIEGKTDPDATVIINSTRAILFSEGNFSHLVVLNEGENLYQISSTDPAGNKTELSLSIYYYP